MFHAIHQLCNYSALDEFFSDLGGFGEYLVIHVTSFDLHCSKFYHSVLSHSVMSNSLTPHGQQPASVLCPWGFSKQEHWSGLPCSLLQGIFPTHGSNPGLLHYRQILYQPSYQGHLCTVQNLIKYNLSLHLICNSTIYSFMTFSCLFLCCVFVCLFV